MNKKRLLFIFLILILLGDFTYSFFQYYATPLDGDVAGGVVPAKDVREIFDDPFGIGVILKNQSHPNPNRYFAHSFFRNYFNQAPLLFQKFLSPIQSVYFSCAFIKLLIQISFIYLLSALITKVQSVFNLNFLITAALLTPLFQAEGYSSYMGIVDKSITYTFFYALPLLLLLLYYSLFYVSRRSNNTGRRFISTAILILLTIILPFSGPLIPPIILIASTLLFIYFFRKYDQTKRDCLFLKRVLHVFTKIPKTILIFAIPICLLCLYSIFLGTYNSTYQTDNIPILERYLRLPKGIYYQFTQKLGFPVLFILIMLNVFLIRKYYYTKNGKKVICSLKWIGLFSLFYILLLPLGGYRPYRPNILRYDTIMPLTVCLIYFYGLSSYFLLRNIKTKKGSL